MKHNFKLNFINYEKFKTFKNYISLNLMSFIGYLAFANALITIFIAKPILNDTTGIDEMFYGVAYGIYTFQVILIQVVLAIIFYGLYKLEKFILTKKEKDKFININNCIFNILFYTGYILFFSPFFILYTTVILITFAPLTLIFDLLNFEYAIFLLNDISEMICKYPIIFFVLIICIYVFIKNTQKD